MRRECAVCGESNDVNNNFCNNCGVEFTVACHECNLENKLDAKFCGGCGLKLKKNNIRQNHTENNNHGERRQLTVMFCDLVGSSELAEQFDPEEFRELLRSYQQCVADISERFEGHIAKYIGDGMLIYFGHPHAHEDDAKRSVLAGLGILEGIEALNQDLRNQNIQLSVRIGIHTGLVVVGEMGSGKLKEKNAIVGETPNIAARIESAAEPNSLVISETTHDLVRGLFVVEDLGKKSLKGVSNHTRLYKVIEESNFLSEFDVRYNEGMSPLVGRNRELDFLSNCWEKAKNGIGQIVWLSGEAGVGKSRIVSDFMHKAASQSLHLRLYTCSSIHTNTAFYPIINYLNYILNFDKKDSDDLKYQHLQTLMNSFDLPLGKYAPYVAPLLGIHVTNSENDTKKLTPDETKKIIIDAWVGLMIAMSEQKPLLLIFEDMHWVDPSTQELINIISSKLSDKRIFLLFTSRPNYKFETEKDFVMQSITLDRLDHKNTQSMISQIAGECPLPEDLIQDLAKKSDGIPLYIEEITKTVMNSSILKRKNNRYELVAPIASMLIPKTLKDSLMARLDQLSDAKQIAQLAATVGRVFSADLLKRLNDDDFHFTEGSLKQLEKARLIEKADSSGQAIYQFRHALLQETAYKSLLKSTRKEYHKKIANALVEHFSSLVELEPETVALHFTQAGEISKAVDHWIQAGMRANITSSHNEAISHFTQAAELLKTLPESKKTLAQDFQVQVRLIGPLIAAQSYVSPLVEKAFTRALELSKKIGYSPEIFPVLHGRYAFYQVCGLIDKAESLVDEFYQQADSQQEDYDTLMMIGNRMRGSSAMMQGNGKAAIDYLQNSINAYDFTHHSGLNALYGQDIKVSCLAYMGLANWHQGKIAEIEKNTSDAIELANKILTANTIGISHIVSQVIPLALLDDFAGTLRASDEAIEIAIKLDTPLWKIAGFIYKGWALVKLGDKLGKEKEGMELLEQGVTAYNNMKLGLYRPSVLNLYAQACMDMGLVVKGIEALQNSLELSQMGGELWLDAESHRIMGELLLKKPDPEPEKAEEEFKLGLNIAKDQQSITQELRVLLSLSRHYSESDRLKELATTNDSLQKVIGCFDENESFRDLDLARQRLNTHSVQLPRF